MPDENDLANLANFARAARRGQEGLKTVTTETVTAANVTIGDSVAIEGETGYIEVLSIVGVGDHLRFVAYQHTWLVMPNQEVRRLLPVSES